jgi:hypothetical protein
MDPKMAHPCEGPQPATISEQPMESRPSRITSGERLLHVARMMREKAQALLKEADQVETLAKQAGSGAVSRDADEALFRLAEYATGALR